MNNSTFSGKVLVTGCFLLTASLSTVAFAATPTFSHSPLNNSKFDDHLMNFAVNNNGNTMLAFNYQANDQEGVSLWQSVDKGATWSLLSSSKKQWANIKFSPKNPAQALGLQFGPASSSEKNTPHLYQTSDAGSHWSEISTTCPISKDSGGVEDVFTYIPNSDNQLVLSNLGGTGIYYSADNGQTCHQTNITSEDWVLSPSKDGSVILASSFSGKVERSIDGGKSWTSVNLDTTKSDDGLHGNTTFSISFSPTNTNNVLAIYDDGHHDSWLWYSLDAGKSWQSAPHKNMDFSLGVTVPNSINYFLFTNGNKGIWQASGDLSNLTFAPTPLGSDTSNDDAYNVWSINNFSYENQAGIAMLMHFSMKDSSSMKFERFSLSKTLNNN
ncbi:hypothetical protein JQC92_03180 [Shewanella sp. 202IG2-18]|uniref:WD40/YVTN/BNR-like repeat-containing protein n=1 Tax=Parashewanella hymeniacidonis TaxID=2807618 RepID=UPI0019611082|nr:hypothetical protein [Parashewanella hymeniacidonis]MBM7071045.1 hypothetical protein [Parashewanella hymeniacidonis]